MSEVTVYLASDLHPSEHVVLQPDYESVVFDLATLREDLAAYKKQSEIRFVGLGKLIDSLNARIEKNAPKLKSLVDRNTRLKWQRNGMQLKLSATEQRNAELVELLREMRSLPQKRCAAFMANIIDLLDEPSALLEDQ